MRLGELEILPVHDGVARVQPSDAYRLGNVEPNGRGGDDGAWPPHRPCLAADGMLEMALGGFLIRTGDRVVLVDAGLGPLEMGPFVGGRLIESLAAAGVTPADVTDALLTPLHFAHVGSTTQAGEVMFPTATYRCDTRDRPPFVGPDER